MMATLLPSVDSPGITGDDEAPETGSASSVDAPAMPPSRRAAMRGRRRLGFDFRLDPNGPGSAFAGARHRARPRRLLKHADHAPDAAAGRGQTDHDGAMTAHVGPRRSSRWDGSPISRAAPPSEQTPPTEPSSPVVRSWPARRPPATRLPPRDGGVPKEDSTSAGSAASEMESSTSGHSISVGAAGGCGVATVASVTSGCGSNSGSGGSRRRGLGIDLAQRLQHPAHRVSSSSQACRSLANRCRYSCRLATPAPRGLPTAS